MANLRIVYNNTMARALSLTASSTAGSLNASNLLTDIKSEVWRSTSTSATITVAWTNAELVSCVAFPFGNFTPTLTARVRGYTNVADSSPAIDTTAVLACPYTTLWSSALPVGANAFAYIAAPYANVWFAQTSVKKIVIDLVDSANASGYVEAGRLVVGDYWSPSINAEYGAAVTMTDNSKHYRTDAGDLMTDIGSRARKISINFAAMVEADRAQVMNIIRGNGMPNPLYFSLFPDCGVPDKEQAYQMYCKLSQISAISTPYFDRYSMPLELEEI